VWRNFTVKSHLSDHTTTASINPRSHHFHHHKMWQPSSRTTCDRWKDDDDEQPAPPAPRIVNTNTQPPPHTNDKTGPNHASSVVWATGMSFPSLSFFLNTNYYISRFYSCFEGTGRWRRWKMAQTTRLSSIGPLVSFPFFLSRFY
jgi:hypothetical protein